MTAIVVYGAGGHGRVVADAARTMGLDVTGFVIDADAADQPAVWGLPVRRWAEVVANQATRPDIVLGIGDGRAREASLARTRSAGFEIRTVVHRSAVVASSAHLGVGAVVIGGAVVNPDATIGDGAIINTGAVVDHDCDIGEFALIGPGAALGGGVVVGPHTVIGVGAAIRPGVRVGARVTVGAGAAVVADVANDQVVVGIPARPIERR